MRVRAPRRIRTANLLITSELPYRWAIGAYTNFCLGIRYERSYISTFNGSGRTRTCGRLVMSQML